MTNTTLLKELIAKSGLKLKYVADHLGLSADGFSKKVNNEQEFKVSEVEALCELLNIKDLELKERIFFAKEDDLKSTLACV